MNPIAVKDTKSRGPTAATPFRADAANEKAFALRAFIAITVFFVAAWILTG